MGNELKDFLINKITAGPLRFYDFMKYALYHPDWGYYVKDKTKIGKEGDFYTSPHVHNAFGYCIAEQLYEMWLICNKPKNFQLIEMGPGTGLLASDILDYSQKYEEFFAATKYILIETSPYMTKLQKKLLKKYASKCIWNESIVNIDSFIGVVFSNEFFDAFPVHKVAKIGDELKEVYVNYLDGSFYETYGEISSHEIVKYINELQIELKDGQELEINLKAGKWLAELSSKLHKGFVITIDYGYKTDELQEPFRFKGTLMSYFNHTNTEDVLKNPGNQDITSHVNFSALKHFGEKVGLKTAGYTSQMRFLINLGIADKMNLGSGLEGIKNSLALKRLTMPDGMGERFKVLVQYKGLEAPKIKGLNGFFNALKI